MKPEIFISRMIEPEYTVTVCKSNSTLYQSVDG